MASWEDDRIVYLVSGTNTHHGSYDILGGESTFCMGGLLDLDP